MEAVCVFFWSANQGLQLCVCFWCPRLFTKKNNLLFIFSFSPAEPPVLLEHFWNTTKIYLFKKKNTKKGWKGNKVVWKFGSWPIRVRLLDESGRHRWLDWTLGSSLDVRVVGSCQELSGNVSSRRLSRVGWRLKLVETGVLFIWRRGEEMPAQCWQIPFWPKLDLDIFIAFMNFPIAWYGQLFFGRHFDGRNRQ